MKRILAFVLAVLLSVPLSAGSIKAPDGFAGKLYAGTFALYASRGTEVHFRCTAWPYKKIPGGYGLMSAGHCVQGTPSDVAFSVAEQIGGPRMPIAVVKFRFSDNTDFSIFELKTAKHYPVFELGAEADMHIGDPVINPNFALGLGKQISRGFISSDTLVPTRECDTSCSGGFLVQMYGAGGSSGSPVLSEKTHKVIGICVYGFDGNVGFTAEPISTFAAFLAAPGQSRPAPEAEDETNSRSIIIIIGPGD